jgi:hypothetical protein
MQAFENDDGTLAALRYFTRPYRTGRLETRSRRRGQDASRQRVVDEGLVLVVELASGGSIAVLFVSPGRPPA